MNVPETAIRLTVDAVVFGYRDEQLFVALINRKYPPYENQWARLGMAL